MAEFDLQDLKSCTVNAAFLLPVVNGKLYLGQRGTEPYKKYWGAIGGKSESNKAQHPWNKPKLIEKMGGQIALSYSDSCCKIEGREYLQGTAIREFCEEIFSNLRFPEDFKEGDISDVAYAGHVWDRVKIRGKVHDTANYFYLARVNRTDFSLSGREITGFKPLREIASEDRIFPLTKLVLAHIHWVFEFAPPFLPSVYQGLHEQIEPFLQKDFIKRDEPRSTDMCGPMIYYKEFFYGKPTSDRETLVVLARIRNKQAQN